MTLPTFLGIGAQRSGTTWLDAHLRAHPEIFLPQRRKEVHFFDEYYHRGLDWYQEFFPSRQQAETLGAVGEITPKYLYHDRAAERIRQCLPDCRLIAVLRNPVERAYSHYGLSVKKHGERRSFEDFLEQCPEAFDRGLYDRQLRRFFDQFPRANMLVLIFERAVLGDPVGTFGQIADFLGIDAHRISAERLQRPLGNSYHPRFPRLWAVASRAARSLRSQDLDWVVNTAKTVGMPQLLGKRGELPPLSPPTRAQLLEEYRPSIERLEHLLDEDLSLWKEPASAAA